jgi:hypothetical protein
MLGQRHPAEHSPSLNDVGLPLFALRGEVDEAIYEAIHASRAPDEVRALVLQA